MKKEYVVISTIILLVIGISQHITNLKLDALLILLSVVLISIVAIWDILFTKKLKPKPKKTEKFPEFFFSSDMYYGWVSNEEDLLDVFDIYSKSVVLNSREWKFMSKCTNPNKSFSIEKGKGETLKEFLSSKGYELRKVKL